MAMPFKLAIIGGGYAGFNLARLLDAHVDVTLIEAREAFVHNVAAIRAAVEPALLDRIVIPYDRLLKNGRVVHGRATAINATGWYWPKVNQLTRMLSLSPQDRAMPHRSSLKVIAPLISRNKWPRLRHRSQPPIR